MEQTKEIGRWLGVSKDDTDVVSYNILASPGRVIHTADAIPWAENELKDENKFKQLREYDEIVQKHFADDTICTDYSWWLTMIPW